MQNPLKYKQYNGFTLIELLVAISVLVIVMTIAIPSFQSVIQNNYASTLNNDLVNTLYFARSEAIQQGSNVSICPAQDQNLTSCGSNWNNGWLVFIDPTNAGSLVSGTTLLRTHALPGQNANITTSPSTSAITYNSSGFAAANATNVTFNVSATGCTGTNARTVKISMTGYLTINSVTCP